MQTANTPAPSPRNASEKTLVQVVETKTGTVFRELDATSGDPEKVAEGAMRNLDPHRYFTRIVGPGAPAPKG